MDLALYTLPLASIDALLDTIKHLYSYLPPYRYFVWAYFIYMYARITWRLVKYTRAKDTLGIKGCFQFYGILTLFLISFILLQYVF